VLEVVREAEAALAKPGGYPDKEYLPITGDPEFVSLVTSLAFGSESAVVKERRVAGAQSLSGTGALRLASRLLGNLLRGGASGPGGARVYISDPTWAVHGQIFEGDGWATAKYRYWDAKSRGLDFAGMLEDLEAAREGDVVLLHACAHNPTGVDPTHEQWGLLADLIIRKRLFPLMDSAYQGFASGDLDKDTFALRLFADRGIELALCLSFAKNLGLYCERVGLCAVAVKTEAIAKAVHTNFSSIIRPMYSNPPAHGARIVKYILSRPDVFQRWQGELKIMSGRIIAMRKALRDELERIDPNKQDWSHITSQIGMFSYTGLTRQQSELMTSKHSVYMLQSGRISMAGVNTKNVARLAAAIIDVIQATKA
jgi:aspartate/tyrosine/aromatic aminotransferase